MGRKIVTRRQFLRWSALAAGAAALAACTPKAAPEPTAAPSVAVEQATSTVAAEQPTAAATPPEASREVMIRVAGFDWQMSGDSSISEADWVKQTFYPQFRQSNPNVNPIWEPYGEDAETKTLTQMVAGTAPDVLLFWSPVMEVWSEKGQILDIQPLIDRDIPDEPKKLLPAIWEQMWHPFKKMRMGWPVNLDVTSVYYNKTAFEEAGVPLPAENWTWEEYTETARKLTKKDANGKITRWGGCIRFASDWWLGYFLYVLAFGGKVRDEETRMECLLGEAEAQEALEWIHRGMWEENCFIQPDQVGASGLPDPWGGGFAAGLLASAEESMGVVQIMKTADTWELDVAPVPGGPKGTACMGIPSVYMIYTGTQRRGTADAAWAFLRYLASEESERTFVNFYYMLPVHTTLFGDWTTSLRKLEPKLEKVNLEAIVGQLTSGQARAPEMFRFQSEAAEIIDATMQTIYVTGKEPVASLKGIVEQVNKAEVEALARANA